MLVAHMTGTETTMRTLTTFGVLMMTLAVSVSAGAAGKDKDGPGGARPQPTDAAGSARIPTHDSHRSEAPTAGREQHSEEQMQERHTEEHASEDSASGHGNEVAQEMRQRRDERKEIQGQYREEGEKTTGKKPWWKFWSDD